MSGAAGRKPRAHGRDFADRNQQLAYVASLYYEGRQSQAEIGAELGLSRSMISRMLDDAHRRGLIEIRINWPLTTIPEMEQRLKQAYALRGAKVVDASGLPYATMLKRLGVAANNELQALLRDGMVISVAWGSALWETVQAVQPATWKGIDVVQCIGALGRVDAPADGPALAQLLAQRLGGRYRYLHAPLVVDSEELCRGLVADRGIAETLALAAQADVALVGVGTIDLEHSSLIRTGYLSAEGVQELRNLGAVGDVCARYFDENGQAVGAPIDRRIVGIGLEALKRIPIVMAVAGGAVKAQSLLGALRGEYLDILVTDRAAAEILLDEAGA